MEKKTYVAPESEAVYLRMEMNFTLSQEEQPIDGPSY